MSWHELAESALSWLVNDQGASVRKDRIGLTPRPFRYARIRWLDGKPIAFSAIHAEYVVERQPARQLDTIVLQGSPGPEGRDLVYTAPIAIPARSLGLVFTGQNVVMPVQVGHYEAVRRREAGGRTTARLQSLVNTTFYQMVQDGRRRASGDVGIPVTHASQWIVRPQTDVSERPALPGLDAGEHGVRRRRQAALHPGFRPHWGRPGPRRAASGGAGVQCT